MIRTSTIGVSVFALLTAAACAQEDPSANAAAETETRTQILDASQVTTREEAKLFAKSEFTQADLNGDGNIDEGEFIAYASVRAPMASTTAPEGEGDATAPAETAGAGSVASTAEEQFAEISNGGESITETRLAEVRVEQFDQADADGDETLDMEERIQFASLTAPKTSETAL